MSCMRTSYDSCNGFVEEAQYSKGLLLTAAVFQEATLLVRFQNLDLSWLSILGSSPLMPELCTRIHCKTFCKNIFN